MDKFQKLGILIIIRNLKGKNYILLNEMKAFFDKEYRDNDIIEFFEKLERERLIKDFDYKRSSTRATRPLISISALITNAGIDFIEKNIHLLDHIDIFDVNS